MITLNALERRLKDARLVVSYMDLWELWISAGKVEEFQERLKKIYDRYPPELATQMEICLREQNPSIDKETHG